LSDINKIITQTASETASSVVSELKRQGLMRDNKQTPFQKTEQLLYNYNNFRAAIEDKHEQVKNIKDYGLPQKSKSITSFTSGGSYEIQSDSEKAEDKVLAIESLIIVTRKFIAIIDSALQKISDDPYYKIIDLKYFNERSREEIAEIMNVDVSTITRNKNRLINVLKITLFSDEVIYEIFS